MALGGELGASMGTIDGRAKASTMAPKDGTIGASQSTPSSTADAAAAAAAAAEALAALLAFVPGDAPGPAAALRVGVILLVTAGRAGERPGLCVPSTFFVSTGETAGFLLAAAAAAPEAAPGPLAVVAATGAVVLATEGLLDSGWPLEGDAAVDDAAASACCSWSSLLPYKQRMRANERSGRERSG